MKEKVTSKCTTLKGNDNIPSCKMDSDSESKQEEHREFILDQYKKHPKIKKLVEKIFNEYEQIGIDFQMDGYFGINSWRYSFNYSCKETGAQFTMTHQWLPR